MDYQKIHDSIIERAKTRILEGYKERHHIVPKCMGGTNDNDNLVYLTAKEHFVIHKLLCLIYPKNNKLHWAAFRMANGSGNKNQKRDYTIGSREYQRLRESVKHSNESIEKMRKSNLGNKYRLGITHSNETKEKLSELRKGKTSPMKDKQLSDEHRAKLSIAAKNRTSQPHSDETKQKMSETWTKKKNDGYVSPNFGNKHTEEAKKKISESKKGVKKSSLTDEWKKNLSESLKGKAKDKIWITDGINATMITKDLIIPSGWWKGMLPRKHKTK
jgi:hypothetical protein